MSTQVEISPEAMAAVAEGYDIRDTDRVRDWLTQYPFLVPILLDMRPEIQKRFPDAAVRLDVTDDPEEDFTQLLAWIRTKDGSVSSRIERMDELDDLLWQNDLDITQDKLAFLLG